MKAPVQKPQPHAALKRLRELCGMTAERFSRLTGIGYAQLVSVEQGRRELSEIDALMIFAATGADASFNLDKTNLKIKAINGEDYDSTMLSRWRENTLPALRDLLASARKEGDRDQMEACVANNARELIVAARSRGQELAVFHYLQHVIAQTAARFGLDDAMTEWRETVFRFSPPARGGKNATRVAIETKTRKMPGLGRQKES
jgi:transcriptional regulator with XRE-family HTH domain